MDSHEILYRWEVGTRRRGVKGRGAGCRQGENLERHPQEENVSPAHRWRRWALLCSRSMEWRLFVIVGVFLKYLNWFEFKLNRGHVCVDAVTVH